MSSENFNVFGLLKHAALKSHLGHGLLLVSRSTTSESFTTGVHAFVAFLMCTQKSQTPELRACGRCDSCLAVSAVKDHGSIHPDLFWIRPESKSGYAVEQIKDLRSALAMARSIADEKVVVIEDAEELGAGGGAAANALLKLLEEPRPRTRLLLLSSRPEGVLATLRSRCQLFRVPLPVAEMESSGLDIDTLDSWKDLWNWLARGLEARDWPLPVLPPDQDGYFKDREKAYSARREVFWEAWRRARALISSFDLEQSRALMRWFEAFDELLTSFRFHGQGPLQWSAFKSRASLERP